MSTKRTIAHGDDFHLYYECFDEDNVYLRINGVILAIPGRIWNQLVAKGKLKSWGGEDFDHPLTQEERMDNRIIGFEEGFREIFSILHPEQEEEDKE